MGPIFNDEINVFSALTLALMEDSGWYKPNYNLAAVSVFGLGAGCNFVEKDCIVNGLVPSYSKGSFCNSQLTPDSSGRFQGDTTCDPSHFFIAQCDLVDQNIVNNGGYNIPQPFQYFPNPRIGPWKLAQADFCPTASLRSVDCRATKNSNFPGEVFSPTSKCFNARVPSLGLDNFSLCLRTYCNPEEHALEIFVGNRKILCEYDGQVHQYPTGLPSNGATDIIECPRYAVVCPHLVCPQNCAGRGICNFGAPRPRCDCFDPTDFTPNCIETPYAATAQFVAPPSTDTTEIGDAGAGLTVVDRPDRPVEGVVLDQASVPTIEELMMGSLDDDDGEEKSTAFFFQHQQRRITTGAVLCILACLVI